MLSEVLISIKNFVEDTLTDSQGRSHIHIHHHCRQHYKSHDHYKGLEYNYLDDKHRRSIHPYNHRLVFLFHWYP